MERDEERLDEIASSLRHVIDQQVEDRAERRERDERIEGRLSKIEHRQDDAERREKSRANEWLQVLDRVSKAETAARRAQQSADEAVHRSAEHMGAVITHIGKMDARLTRQDADLEALRSETGEQTTKLDRLVAADTERALFERWQREQSAARTKTLERILWWVKASLAVGGLVGMVITAIVWILPHFHR